MKKILKKVGLIIMAITTMITMNACSKVNNDTANEVCAALSEKYGESFEATKIGDRFNTDSAKLYIHPSDNDELLFTASINRTTGEVTDDYVTEKVNYQVEKSIREEFNAVGVSADSRCMVVTRNELVTENEEYNPESFMERYSFDNYMVYLIINGDGMSVDKIHSAITQIGKNLNVKLIIAGYVFDSTYGDCLTELKQSPEMSITMIEAHNPTSTFDVTVDGTGASISLDELSSLLGRS